MNSSQPLNLSTPQPLNPSTSQQTMNTNRRVRPYEVKLLTGLLLIVLVSCVSPHYRRPDNAQEPPGRFEPVAVERPDGFYALSSYTPGSDPAGIELEARPVITLKEVGEVKKTVRYSGTYPEVNLKLTEEGSQKLYMLTKANIGKPIAIVIENQIVAMPMVMAAVADGRVSIAGGFSEEEIDRIIERIKN